MNEPQTILDAEWVLLEEAPTTTLVCAPTEALEEPAKKPTMYVVEGAPLREIIVALGLYSIFTALMIIVSIYTSGTIMPLFNSAVFTMVWLCLGLFLVALLVIALPAMDGEQVAACTPARNNTLTGR